MQIKNVFFGNPRRAAASGVLLFMAAALAEFALPDNVETGILYIIPIFALALHHGKFAGLTASFGGAAACLLDGLFSRDFALHPGLYLWNALMRLASFAALVLLLDAAKKKAAEKTVPAAEPATARLVSHKFNNALNDIFTAVFALRETEPAELDETRSRIYATIDSSEKSIKRYMEDILAEREKEKKKQG